MRQFRITKDDSDLNSYINARKRFKALCSQKQRHYDTKKLNDLTDSLNNPKSFWSKLKHLTNRNSNTVTNNITTSQWVEHFKHLLNPPTVPDNAEGEHINDFNLETDSDIEEFIFNSSIEEDEIRMAVKHLHAGKSPGPDNIIPEFFIFGIDTFIDVLRTLFNRLYTYGEFPNSWSESIIVTLHKKGSVNDTNNYRGISLQNILSKIYCRILVSRLNFYVNMFNKISENQAGFKAGYSTVDNAFVLNSVIFRALSRKQGKIYVAFIDFHKCLDTINRECLWAVIKERGIKGKLYAAIHSMYNCVKSCIRCNNDRSEYIDCTIGLKQGCLASPILFSLFIDEFEKILKQSDIRGIQLHPDVVELFLLMFADDIALLSDTVMGLQSQLNILADFCETYKLKVNEAKTKIAAFKKGGRLSRHEKWTYMNHDVEVVNRFCYVGLTFTSQWPLNKMVSELCTKGKRTLTSILHALYKNGQMPKSMFFKIFDTKISPQLCYGSEIWGMNTYNELERCQYYACKRFMCAKQNACNYFVLGECARYPMYNNNEKMYKLLV